MEVITMKKTIYWVLVFGLVTMWLVLLTSSGITKNLDFPTKPIQIIVPYPAGGGMDVVARIISKHAEKYAKNKFIVINKTGGGGSIGTNEISRSNPDGYTTGLIAPSTLTSEYTIPGCPFTYKDFTPLVEVTEESHALIIKNSLKMDFKQFIDYVKKNPQKASISIGGEWNSHDFFRAKLEKYFGIKFLRIPYQGGAPALQAVAGGHVDSSTPFISEGLPIIEGKMVTAIAISGTERSSVLPNIPTIKETGYDLVHVSWRALALPVGVSPEIINYLDGVFSKTMNDPELVKDFTKAGIYPRLRSHKEFVKYYKEEYDQYSTLLKELGFQVK
jgi:tripartite-type tricarboxylate transporter receptor subunit TctC